MVADIDRAMLQFTQYQVSPHLKQVRLFHINEGYHRAICIEKPFYAQLVPKLNLESLSARSCSKLHFC
jgi:hypothetical protein